MRNVAESCKRVFASTYFDEPEDASVAPAPAGSALSPALPHSTTAPLAAPPGGPLVALAATAAEQSPAAARPHPDARAGSCAHHDSGARTKRKAALIAQDACVARSLQESMIHIGIQKQRRRPGKLAKLTRLASSDRR